MLFRIRDILFSLLLLILLSPLFLFLILLLKIIQKEVFFSQTRTGKNEQPFRIHKFASLRDSGKNSNQPLAFTPTGKFLRRWGLNELPQLWNILKGEMSFVGPRPLLHEYLPRYSAAQKKRFWVRPGITGWAQVEGHSLRDWKQRLELDIWYAEHQSFLLDLKILLRTTGILFTRGKKGEPQMEEFKG